MANKKIQAAGSKGGLARRAVLSPAQRQVIAKRAAEVRWDKERAREISAPDVEATQGTEELPTAAYRGFLNLMGMDVPCYVLSTGQKVIGRTSFTEMLTGIKGGGGFEKYLGVKALNPFIDMDLVLEKMVPFGLPEVTGLGRQVRGLPADLAIEICRGFVRAMEMSQLTTRQLAMGVKASSFLAACAKVGLDALIDEATGYQYDRVEDALQVKLRAYLSEEFRAWEKTFPDELWHEFGRLTNWQGQVTKRPKYWGKLVNELVYEYLDPDIAEWLKKEAPAPRKGQNYHQWLSAQYGLKKLIEHIWMLIGISRTCATMFELRTRVAELNGKRPVQLVLFVPKSLGPAPVDD